MRFWRGGIIVFACALLIAGPVIAQRGRSTASPLPPISLTCPLHPDVIETVPGSCPYCKNALVPVRLAPAWTCPVHAATIADDRGACPICRRQLVPVTVTLTFTCAGSPAALEPGNCPGGAPRRREQALRPHGDHNPRHGGQFFMASDNRHHVEGVHPSGRQFRLYVYDDYARPLPTERMQTVRARVVTSERFDPTAKAYIEQRAFPLSVSGDGAYLEARIDAPALPAEMTAKVRFDPDGPEHRFDFTFMTLTQTPASPGPAAAVVRLTSTPSNPASDPQSRVPDPRSPAIPPTVPGILEQLRTRDQEVASLIALGDFGALWVPAFQARDLALALEPHLAHLDGEKRDTGATALQRIVRISWLLDAHGDTGNRQPLLTARAALSAAIADAVAAFGEMKH